MIAWSEGTSRVKGSDDGYNVLVGGRLFAGYADHPREVIEVRPGLYSTAAGRYQLLARYFDYYKRELNLPDFAPISQDKIAIQQIKERNAIQAISGGHLDDAIRLCANIWASLPGAGYGQHENSIAELADAYCHAGGVSMA
ncbi:MAG: glycoside hydrolase family 104 protein [Betaproteobacteria bacterium]|nr:glycoside hydrolase family 104 protein [Betaproteobacteria bacterium]